MAGRRHRPNVSRFRGRRLVGAIAVPLVAAALVTIPAEPAAHAALNNLTNFEIDANQVVNGPTPPSGGAGIDWANATSFLQDVDTPTEACAGLDPTIVSGKLNAFDPFAPNPQSGNINAKDNLCQAFVAWEPVPVTSGGVTSVHYILYGGWRRNAVTGDMSFFIPLIGGSTKSAVTLVQFNFDPSAGGSTSVGLLQWSGTAWVPNTTAPTSAFQGIAEPGTSPAFGEFAVDLTAAGVLPAQTCASVVSSYVITRPGNGNADLEDYLGVKPLQISNCSTVRITKATTPAISGTPVDFTYTLDRVDGGPVQDTSPLTPPNTDANASTGVIAGTLTVPTTPTDVFTNIFAAGSYRLLENLPPPAPWSHQSVVCNYFNPLVLDVNNKATPATATLTNANGSWSGQTFTVAPTGLLPAGVTVAATCTISNQAPSLTLTKQVVNTVGNVPATADMWTLAATPVSGIAIDFGPGTETGVTRVVAPSTYTLAETPNPANPPPLGYTAGPWSCVDALGNTVPVTGSQVVIGATANFTCTITNTASDLARLTLHKVVVGGTATVGQFTLTASQGGAPGSIDGLPISGTDGSASVTARPVQRGSFALGESGPPGYVPSWVCTNGAGTVVSRTNGVEIPAAFTDPNQLVVSCTVTNTTTTLDIDVSAAAINPAGRSHTFTLTAHRVDTGAPLQGALLNLTFSDPGLVTGNTCQPPALGTNVNGQCTVTVSSNSAGPFVLTVLGFTNQGVNAPLPGEPFTLPVPVSTTKLWTTYRVEGDSAINLVGDTEHTFTLRGFQNDGTTESALPGGSVIAYTWSGGGPVSPPGQCTVDAGGTCDVTVSAATTGPESGTLTVTSVTVTLPDGTGGSTSYTLSAGDVALSAPLPVLTKSWVGFRVRVEPSAQVNLVGQPHTFTVTAEFATTPGVWQPVNGGTVALAWASSVANPDPSSTCPVLSTAGTCTFTVVQPTPFEPGVGVLTATGLSVPGVTIGGQTTIITEPIGSAALDLTAATAQKTWVLVDVTITPGVDNLAGEPHNFTVQVTGFDGDGPFPDGTGVPGAIVTSSVVSSVGGAAVTGNTCATGTNAEGQCTLTVFNTGSGSIVLQLEQVSVTIDGTPFVIDLTPGARGLRSDAVLPIRTDKVWWQYRVRLSDSAINPLGVTHTFTATVERTNDGAATWQAVPDGAHLDFVWIDPNTVSQVDPSSTCLTTGTLGGTCTFVVSSTAATTGTLDIRGIIDTFLDRNRDGLTGGPTDPIPDPVEFANEIVDIPAAAFGQGSVLTARKTWWNFTVDVSGPAENPVGTDHTFTLTTRFSDGSPAGFQPVSPGTTMTYAWSGPAGSAEDTTRSTCDPANGPGTNINGQCTVVIASPTFPGTGTLTITGIASTSIPQPTRTVSFTFPTPGTTTKTWIAYRALISPSATNLTGTPHTFTVTVEQDRGDGTGFVAVPDGTTIDVALSDPTKLTGNTCTGGTVGGTCTLTVNSSSPGAVTVTPGAITVSLLDGTGARVPVSVVPGSPAYATPGSATKTWVSVGVSVTPLTATNLVGQSHTFTVHVDVIGADGTTTPQPAPDGATVAWTFNGPGILSTGATTCNTVGTVGGTCDIVFTNNGTPGSGTLTITSVTFSANGQTFSVDLTVAGPAQATQPPITATKTWGAYAVTITTSANNPVGTQHDFTITANVDNGTTTIPAAGATIAFTWTGAGTLLTPSPCTTSASGTCIVSVTSLTAGTGTLTVTSLTDSAGAVVDLTTPGAPGQAAGQVVPLTASKVWLQYRVLLEPAATNLVGVPHTFIATVQQSALANPTDADWTAVPNGTTLTASAAGEGMLDPASTCLTGGTTGGTCTLVVHDAGPGTLDLTVSAIAGTTVDGAAFTNIALTSPATTSKTWVSAAVSVTPPTATNLVGQSHTFTVHVDVIGADGTTTPQPAPDGTTVTWTFNGPGIVAAGATTCNVVGTVGGACDIVLTNDGTPGSGTLTITAVTFTVNGQLFTVDLSTTGPGQATPPPITATKTWGAYAVTITPSANNPVGTQHDFTITATLDNGTTTTPAVGADIAFTWTGAGTLLTPSPCTTSASGTCIVSVTSPASGSGTLTVTSLIDSAGAVVDLTTPGAPGQAAGQVVPLTASKVWLQYRVLLEPAATNLVGASHTFTATVQFSPAANPTPADWFAAPDGTTLTASTAGEGTLDPASTCLTGGTSAGTCTLVVHDAGPGTLDLTVSAIAGTTVDGTAFTNIALTSPATTSKTWVSVAVSVTPPTATNLVGQAHTFSVHVDVIGADGTTTTQPAPDGATVAWTFNGPGTVSTGSTTCDTTGTVGGTCTITLTNNGTAGAGTLTITSVTFTVNGQTFTVDLTAGGPAQATPPPITATKTWGAYAVTITPSANNPVGTQHDFTITATLDNGTTTTPAAGADITFTWTGAGTLLTPSPCTTGASGTCTVSVTSPAAGTGTLTVTSLTDSAGAVVDLTTPGAPGQAAGQVVPLTTSKTWLQYRVLFDTTAATNLIGVSHTFTATVQQSAVANPTPADWSPVFDGTTLTASTSGEGTLDPASTCLTGGTSGGTCTLVVHDAGPGTLDLTVTAIAGTTIGGVSFTDIALTSPATASKTWLSSAVSVTPPTATNLVGQSHTFTVHVDVIGADGTTTPQPAPDGTTVTWTFNGPGTVSAGTTTCDTTGTAAGTCAITLTNNGTAGAGTLTITSVTFTVNGQPFTVDLTTAGPGQATPPPITATKSWGNFRVTVTPATATNYVGEPHTFTVLVEHDTGTGFQPVAGAPVSLSASGTAVPNPAIPMSCTTDAAGTCTITTTSSVPGTLTVTATYEAASDSGVVPFTGTGEKEWIPGWTLRITKASSVAGSTQLFAFQTDGPPPLAAQSFSLAIGQTQLYEGLLPGTYTMSELTDAAHLPAPWRFESLSCTGLATGASVAIDGAQATLTLAPPSPGSEITCTYTNERMNLFVHKTDGGVTAVAGGDPFDYTLTVGNNGSVATSAPITVTDTLPAGMTFAGPAQAPAGGSCAPPVGQVLTCTLTAPIPPGGTVQIVVPARALTSAASSVVNVVKIDSTEDVLCPDGTCPPPPTCPTPPAGAAVAVAAVAGGGDPSDNQACVRTPVEPASTVGPESGGSTPPTTVPPPAESSSNTGLIPFTGSTTFPLAIGAVCLLVGLALSMLVRRRRSHRSA